MKHFRQSASQYLKRITVRGMGIMLAAATAYMVYLSAYASQMGTIPDLAAHVYANTDTDSNIVANVIMGDNFPILAEETDGEGNAWYLIETEAGTRGYIPAGNVIRVTPDSQTGNTQNENVQAGSAQTREPANEDEDEDNIPENAHSQILAAEVVNIRENPTTTDEIVGKIPRGTTLDYIDIVTNEGGEEWYEVSYEEVHGYVKQSTVRLIETPAREDGMPSDITDVTVEHIDIDQMIETARLYQDENPPKDTTAEADNLNEAQVQEQAGYEDGLIIDENAEETVKKGLELHIDAVIILSTMGIFICAAVISRTFGKMVKLYR